MWADGRTDEAKAFFMGMGTRLKIGNYLFFYRNSLYYHIWNLINSLCFSQSTFYGMEL